MNKIVQELETKNSIYQNELLEVHKWFIKIGKTLGSIDSEWTMLKQILNKSKMIERLLNNLLA
jgi:hypothetical protein